jgi:sporulation protein YlmC with PRC-barrel domain
MTVNFEKFRLSDLIGKPVIEAESGDQVGRAWDVRVKRQKKSAQIGSELWVATALVVTSRGALERFGFVHLRKFSPRGEWRSSRETIPWHQIQRITANAIFIVR